MTEHRISYKPCSITFTLRADLTPRATLPGRAEDVFAVTPVSLEAQFSPAQRGLRRSSAHGGGTQYAIHHCFHRLFYVSGAPRAGPVYVRLEVTPQEEFRWGQIRGAGWSGARPKQGVAADIFEEVGPNDVPAAQDHHARDLD